ncbi:MAG: hypothetical protein D3924_17655 [Candidatus Electrothrix sp. AR4]|nr:hypothetical protein [Candidatus Electrothrix sp. AR4]
MLLYFYVTLWLMNFFRSSERVVRKSTENDFGVLPLEIFDLFWPEAQLLQFESMEYLNLSFFSSTAQVYLLHDPADRRFAFDWACLSFSPESVTLMQLNRVRYVINILIFQY